jgi:hypothetical protein
MYFKPSYRVTYRQNPPREDFDDIVQRIITWMTHHTVATLNIAGNRESVAPGIKRWATELLMNLFHTLVPEEEET